MCNRQFLSALMLTLCSLMFYISAASAVDKKKTYVASLSGIKGMGFVVEDVSPDVERDGLSITQIQSDIEQKLRAAGITLLGEEALIKAPGMPFLHCNIFAVKNAAGICAYHITLEFYQMVSLIRKPAIKQSVATWKIAGGGTVDTTQISEIRNDVKSYVDKFITAYKTANQ